MNKLFVSLGLVLGLLACETSNNKVKLVYPETRKDTTVVDDYFGVKVKDPYRWLEDDNSEETKAWVNDQNKVAFDYLASIPQRAQIKQRLGELWNYEKQTAPWRKGPFLYYYKNDGVQNQSVLFYKDTLGGEGKVLLDPNTFSDDGTASLAGLGTSEEGKYVAYMVSKSGSDWREIFVKESATGKLLDDHIKWVKFSGISWSGEGFYYSRYDAPEKGNEYSASNTNHKVFYHKIGTSQNEDVLVKKDDDHPNWNFGVFATDDQAYDFMYVTESTSGVQYAFRKAGEDDFTFLDTTFSYSYNLLDNRGGKFLIQTSNGAPNYRLVGVDASNPSEENWKDVVPEIGRAHV